jgi:hypothetical protein
MAADGALIELFELRCRWCRGLFGVCERCYRGQRYCSSSCRRKGRRRRARARNRRYQRRKKGRTNNQKRQKEFRRRRKARVTDATGIGGSPSPDLSATDHEGAPKNVGAPPEGADARSTEGSSAGEGQPEGATQPVADPAARGPDTPKPPHEPAARPAPAAAPECIRCHRRGFFVDRDPDGTFGCPRRTRHSRAPVRPRGARSVSLAARHPGLVQPS